MPHDHAHDHTHDHAHHHDHGGHGNRTRLAWTVGLTGSFMVAEAVGGWLTGSLALMADAGHMLTDTGALALAWYAERAAARPADTRHTYGHQRFPVVAAFVNGLALIAIVAWIAAEAIPRLMTPQPVLAGPMIAIAVAGLVVNAVVFFILHGTSRADLNIRGALWHVVGDMLGSAGAIIAAGLILAFGWTAADPILSLVIATLVLRGAWGLVRQSGRILMQAAPEGVDEAAVRTTLEGRVDGLADVHGVHAWSLGSRTPVVTLHARVERGADADAVLASIKAALARRLGVEHATVQVERGMCCDNRGPAPGGAAADNGGRA